MLFRSVADHFGIPVAKVRRWIREGRIQYKEGEHITPIHCQVCGKVGNEYFMTKGHFHANIDRAEFYWGLEGEGMLILMDQLRRVWAERIFPGSLHYIPGGVAHRMANTGNTLFSFAACWPSDAGHNYREIADHGFAARLLEVDGKPQLIGV